MGLAPTGLTTALPPPAAPWPGLRLPIWWVPPDFGDCECPSVEVSFGGGRRLSDLNQEKKGWFLGTLSHGTITQNPRSGGRQTSFVFLANGAAVFAYISPRREPKRRDASSRPCRRSRIYDPGPEEPLGGARGCLVMRYTCHRAGSQEFARTHTTTDKKFVTKKRSQNIRAPKDSSGRRLSDGSPHLIGVHDPEGPTRVPHPPHFCMAVPTPARRRAGWRFRDGFVMPWCPGHLLLTWGYRGLEGLFTTSHFLRYKGIGRDCSPDFHAFCGSHRGSFFSSVAI